VEIVKVRIGDSEKEYSYFSEDVLQVGDLVTVPTKYGESKARVTEIGVTEDRIESFRAAVRTIPAGARIEPPPDGTADPVQELQKLVVLGLELEDKDDFVAVTQIAICPEKTPSYLIIKASLTSLLEYAQKREIKTDDDLIPATNDLTVIAKWKKEIANLKDKYVKPIKDHLEDVQDAFGVLNVLLSDANAINRVKMDAYTNLQREKAAEIAEVNRQAEEVARKQAELNQGVFTVDTTPIPAPAPVKHIRTEGGTASIVNKPNDWEIEDPTNMDLIPREYWMLNEVKIGRVIRAGGTIPGIKIIHRTGVSITMKEK
jgi:hypothetical protein